MVSPPLGVVRGGLLQVPLHFSFYIFLLNAFPFVIQFFPFGKTDLYFYKVLFIKINTQRYKCVAFLFKFTFYPVDLSFLQQELAVSHRVMVIDVTM